jgi:hypothetical protein
VTLLLKGAGRGSPSGLFDVFRGTDAINAAQTTYNFTNKAIGDADARRRVVAAIMTRGGANHTHATATLTTSAGAIVFTQIVNAAITDATPHVSLWEAAVPTGTTMAFAFTIAAAPAHCTLHWLTHFRTVASASAADVASPFDPTIAVPDNGLVLGSFTNTNASAITFTWGGGLVQQANTQGNSYVRASAMYGHSGAGANIQFSAVPSAGTEGRFVVAAFGAQVP